MWPLGGSEGRLAVVLPDGQVGNNSAVAVVRATHPPICGQSVVGMAALSLGQAAQARVRDRPEALSDIYGEMKIAAALLDASVA